MEKKKFTSSGPRDYMVISGKRLTTYLTLMTRKRPKNKKRQGLPILMLLLKSLWI